MLCLGKLLPHQCPPFSCGDNVVLSQTVFQGIAVLAVKQTNPARLLAQDLQDRDVLVHENPDRFICMGALESEYRQHILFLR